jgi:FAD/FMN-containing dehydrogenase
MCAYEN